MYYKGFDVFIQHLFSKFFFINKFYFLDGGQSLGNSIGLTNKSLLIKLNVNITEDKKGHF